MNREDIKILTTDDLRHVVDRKERVLEVPEWGGAVVLKALTLAQRDAMVIAGSVDGKMTGATDPGKMLRALVLYGVSQPQLTQEFLEGSSFEVIDRIAQAVLDINGMAKTAPLSADLSFRPTPGTVTAVQAGEGFGQNGRGGAG